MKKIILFMLMLSPFTNAETKYFVCADAVTGGSGWILNDVLQVNIKEEWMQFDEIRIGDVFNHDNFNQEITAFGYGTDWNGIRQTKWELEFNKITGAFVFVQDDLKTPLIDVILRYKCTPTEPVLP